ncbi:MULTISPECIES: hypothetical protein [Halorussus]|uniref:hypothetical protein n=1 Tax=Halorussus TaxID=1070314 RepID=UPI0020A0EB4A|nr:hypothetical protein [Halorussus vallis]USZ75644.1 hypothetical protein NGM07_19725 [Halorussus vallis]USZ75698.1 hypothetical protein NGM07_20000 [Halorussus vallis]
MTLEGRVWPSTVVKSVCYELGAADREHPTELAVAREFCKSEEADFESLEPKDWLLAVFASGGEICLRIDEIPEVAYIGYEDQTLTASVYNNVFLRRRTTTLDSEEAKELIERFTPQLTLRRSTPFGDGEGGESA